MSLKFVEPPSMFLPNILLYGPPKTGKTAGACSAPPGILMMNLDLPNATYYARQRDGEGQIMEIAYEGFDTLVDVHEALSKDTGILRTVVVDPVGELHRRMLDQFSKRAISPTLPTYQVVSVHIERFCRSLCEMPNVSAVFVCHEQPVKDEATGNFERLPWTGTTNPALGQKLMGMVDIIGYTGVRTLEDESHQYVAQLVSDKGRRGGDRFACLGDWQELNLASWVEQINTASTPQPRQEVAA